MAERSADTDELARFGYKEGGTGPFAGAVSSFAAGFSHILIMTGVFELFLLLAAELSGASGGAEPMRT